jgi:hypothetical protein
VELCRSLPEPNEADLSPRADVTRTPSKSARAAEIKKLRSSRAYRSSADRYRKSCHQQNRGRGSPCWLCGQDINYLLPHPHPASFSVDHSIPVNERPDLILDTNLWRPSHLSCNSARGGMNEDIYGPGALGFPSEVF